MIFTDQYIQMMSQSPIRKEGKMKLQWEDIDNYHRRAKVLGGWLVKAYEDVIWDRHDYGQGMASGWDWRIAMCFVPDPNHEWILKEQSK